ncbi:hypothetical protein BO70DRAFT_395533 [Aspergillus heteromorphus CBS 117.55]|uniref:Uncharacterized protein n=1 Tax=Aspergillus heteromorphus CBS 117.55 TaxID=1448321 RepID=A0A317WKX3_9EURO|nr:uncharacterized protein BO70DRAFT_395533 [Aspergillus heteromorphus CBS 117.55]PWY84850.1 hypothetical protein BO70DRAFT_395533 [Aspergillus heteromorphus CBS 117.55]
MNFLLLLFLVFFAPLLLFLAWLGLSSCLGDRLRAYFSASSAGPGMDSYGRDYFRGMGNTGSAMSEQIELENMLDDLDSDHEE